MDVGLFLFMSAHNKGVRQCILSQITQLSNEFKFSENIITGELVIIVQKSWPLLYITLLTVAIQRRYESERRLWLLREKPNGDAIYDQMGRQKKCRSRCKRVSVQKRLPTYIGPLYEITLGRVLGILFRMDYQQACVLYTEVLCNGFLTPLRKLASCLILTQPPLYAHPWSMSIMK